MALFGEGADDRANGTPRGRAVVRLDVGEWRVRPLALDGLLRPVDVRFDADGALWVLDFGRFEMTQAGVVGEPKTGALYCVRSGP